jgi:hypothetical protein
MQITIKLDAFNDEFVNELRNRFNKLDSEFTINNSHGNTLVSGHAMVLFTVIVDVLYTKLYVNSFETNNNKHVDKQRKAISDFVINEWPEFKKFMRC